MKSLPPAFVARAKAVQTAYRHLAVTHPSWRALSPQDRIRAVHAHIARPSLHREVTRLRARGMFK